MLQWERLAMNANIIYKHCNSSGCSLLWMCSVILSFIVVLLFISGCVTELEPGQEPLRPQPRDIPTQPGDVSVDRIQVWPTLYPKDTNGNGIGDNIQTMVYLWANRYNLPLYDNGKLEFKLYKAGESSLADAVPVRQWVYTGEDLSARQTTSQAGPGYYFELSLLTEGGGGRGDGELMGIKSADIVGIYTSSDGKTIISGVSTIQLDRFSR